jgi:hypothetical protein
LFVSWYWSRSIEIQYSAQPIFTTPPQSKKRKAPSTFEDRPTADSKASKKEEAAPQLKTPTTPLTELDSPVPQTMDSEDEYISDASSQEEEDFDGTQDSEAGSVGDGKSGLPYRVLVSVCLVPTNCISEVTG